MTFEEFKENWEKFTKLDTPEKIGICKKQYQKHLLSIEDANFFEPLEEREKRSDQDLLGIYLKNLNTLFDLDQIRPDQVYFFVRPSFEPENLLIIEKTSNSYILKHIDLVTSYWYAYYKDNSIIHIDKMETVAYLKSEIGDKIFLLIENLINEARKPKSKSITLDGIQYQLSKIINMEVRAVFKHSPDDSSAIGKVIHFLQLLVGFTKLKFRDEGKIEVALREICN